MSVAVIYILSRSSLVNLKNLQVVGEIRHSIPKKWHMSTSRTLDET